MALHLVTGFKGNAHITSANQGAFNAGCVGLGEYVLTNGRRFEAEVITSNTIRIFDGSIVMQGRQIDLEYGTFLDVNIPDGLSGMNRNDLIVLRYTKNVSSGVESVSIVVLQGTPVQGVAVDPTYTVGDILSSAKSHDMPLYRVKLSGLTISSVEPMFNTVAPLNVLQGGFYRQNMLINGDFQCNQRGNKTYDVAGTSAYTVDMWRAFQVKVEVLNEGVKLTGKSASVQGYFTQFIQLGKLKTTSYVISAMVDGAVYTFTVTPGASAKEKVFDKFKITCLTMSAWDNDLNDYNNKLKINICPIGTSSFTLTYVDVFEGDILYPHRKEDFATALIRCEKYIVKKGYTAPVYSIYSPSSGVYAYEFVLCLDRMANKFGAYTNPPKIESYTWNYITTSGTANSGENPTVAVYDITNTGGVHTLRTATGTLNMHANCSGIKGTYVVTCEPREA